MSKCPICRFECINPVVLVNLRCKEIANAAKVNERQNIIKQLLTEKFDEKMIMRVTKASLNEILEVKSQIDQN